MDLLTPCVNVPAERAKLRALRDEIAADVQARKEHERRYTPRGFLRDVQPLEATREQRNGAQPLRPLRPWPGVDVPPTKADMRPAQTACCGRCGRPIGMAGEGLVTTNPQA